MADNVDYTHEGTIYTGEYNTWDGGGTVEVRCDFGRKSTQVGGSPPHVIARMMLGEIVRAALTPAGSAGVEKLEVSEVAPQTKDPAPKPAKKAQGMEHAGFLEALTDHVNRPEPRPSLNRDNFVDRVIRDKPKTEPET